MVGKSLLKILKVDRKKFLVCCAAFGFCEFEDPEATLRCMRLLNDWLISDKKLVVSDFLLVG